MVEYKEQELIDELDELWHTFIFNFQNKSTTLWGEELKDATTVEIGILNIIDNKPDVMLKEIKDILNIPSSTLTSAVDRLENKKLVERTISKKDRRSFGLKLTKKGKEAQNKHISAEKEIFKNILEALDSNKEREKFIDSLKKIRNKLKREISKV